MKRDPDNYLLFERDGAFNPTWLYVGAYNFFGIAASCGGLFVAWRTNDPQIGLGVLAFIFLNVLTHLISALPQNKAKILANSKVLEAASKALVPVPPLTRGITVDPTDDDYHPGI